jgi:hypothetical protein
MEPRYLLKVALRFKLWVYPLHSGTDSESDRTVNWLGGLSRAGSTAVLSPLGDCCYKK